VSSGFAFTVTPWSCSSFESASVLAKDGISVLKSFVAFEPPIASFSVNVPWMCVPVEVICLTWPARTWSRNAGLYGMRTRELGCVTRVPK
jgi:hypothetical protein